MNRENDRRSDSQALLEVPPTPDIIALENAAESLTRLGDIPNAIALWAIALRLRQETAVLEHYANPDTWNAVKSPDSTSAWEKVSGHPCPWVDAQEGLGR